jgi:hypothetical protein
MNNFLLSRPQWRDSKDATSLADGIEVLVLENHAVFANELKGGYYVFR